MTDWHTRHTSLPSPSNFREPMTPYFKCDASTPPVMSRGVDFAVKKPRSPSGRLSKTRCTSSSMPNLVAVPARLHATRRMDAGFFFGDVHGWMSTRGWKVGRRSRRQKRGGEGIATSKVHKREHLYLLALRSTASARGAARLQRQPPRPRAGSSCPAASEFFSAASWHQRPCVVFGPFYFRRRRRAIAGRQ